MSEDFPVCIPPVIYNPPSRDFGTARVAATALVRGGIVRPHVQAFAQALVDALGQQSFGTYNGHDPDISLALDIFVPVNDATQGNAVCAFAIGNWDRFGLSYIIYRQRIYNPGVANYWRDMADRGGLTQNHFDHAHLAFKSQAPNIEDEPPEEDFLATLTDKEKAALLSAIESIDANTKNIGTRLFSSLGAGNWETGADRVAQAVRLVEGLATRDDVGGGSVDLDALAEAVAARVDAKLAARLAE